MPVYPHALPILLCLAGAATAPQLVHAQPIAAGIAYTADAFYNAAGGLRRDATLLHNLDLTAAFDGGSVGLDGLEAHAYVLMNRGGSVTALAGERQTASNIEAPSAVRLYELWVQQAWRDAWSVRLGLTDLNGEFYVSEAGALFINSAHGIGPEFAATGNGGPSIFPVTSLAARLKWEPGPFYGQVAIMDGAPGHPENDRRFVHVALSRAEGALLIGELGTTDADRARRVAIGAWRYTGDSSDAVEPEVTRRGPFGLYLLAETGLMGDVGSSGRGLVGFARVGYADESVQPVTWSWGGGLVHSGTFATGDALGVAVTTSAFGARYLEAQRSAGTELDGSETGLEVTYSLQATPWLRLQPDMQLILNPGMDPAVDHALLFGLRAEISH